MNEYTIKNTLLNISRLLPIEKDAQFVLDKSAQMILEEIQKTGLKYDFKVFEDYVIKNYKFKNFPNIKYLLECLPYAQIVVIKPIENQGATIRVYFASGRSTDFVITGYGQRIEDMITRFQNSDNVIKAEFYPPGCTLIGTNIDWGDNEPNSMRILYQV